MAEEINIDTIMSQAQVFASAWSLVGGTFDDGHAIENAIEHPEQAAGLEQLPKGWRRQRPILKALVETLQAAADSKRR